MRPPGKDILMAADTLEEQLVKYLTDAHSIEAQALAQMRSAPGLASDPGLARAFESHEAETERHEQLIRDRLSAHGASPSRLKDAVMAVGGKGFVLFARSQPDTDGKLATHAISYEHLELAAYELLSRVAGRPGDPAPAPVAGPAREAAGLRVRVRAPGDRRLRAPAAGGAARGRPGGRGAGGPHPAPGARGGAAIRSELGPSGRGRTGGAGTRLRAAQSRPVRD